MNLIEKEVKLEDANYEKFYDKDDMQLYINNKGSAFDKKTPLLKSVYKIKKSFFKEGTNIWLLDYFMNEEKIRRKWDKSVKEFKIIEGSEWNNGASYILHYVTTKPAIFVSERDCVDKRYDLIINGVYYDFSSSVRDDVKL